MKNITNKQLQNVKSQLLKIINNSRRSEEHIEKAKYYLSVLDKKSNLEYLIDILFYFNLSKNKNNDIENIRKYIEYEVIKDIKLYNYVNIKSFDNSTNKRRKNLKTLYSENFLTRSEIIIFAQNYIKENKIKLNDVYYDLI